MDKKKQLLVRELKKVKGFEIQRLCKRIRLLKGKKGTDQQRAKNERKVNRLLQELEFLKDVDLMDLAEKIIANNLSELESVEEDSTVEKRVLSKIISSKTLTNKLSELNDCVEEGVTKKASNKKDKKVIENTEKNGGIVAGKQNSGVLVDDENFFQTVYSSEEKLYSDQEVFVDNNNIEHEISPKNDNMSKSNIMQRNKRKLTKKTAKQDGSKGNVLDRVTRSSKNLDFDQAIKLDVEYESASEGSTDEVLSDPLSGSVFVGLMSQVKSNKKVGKNEKTRNSKKKVKNKNRMGQRDRKKLWEKMYGEKADHKKKEKKFDLQKKEKRKMGQRRKITIGDNNSKTGMHQSEENLHPSWQASRKRKIQQNVEFQGKKITFED